MSSTLTNGHKETMPISAKSSALHGHNSRNMPIIEEPNLIDKLNWLIHLQHMRGETSACKELINSEIKKSGGRNEFAYFKQGVIFREENRIQEALNSFQICVKLNPESSDNIKEVAKCLYEMRRYRLSLDAYLEAERMAKRLDWEIYCNIGECLMRLGESLKAKDYAQRAAQLGKNETAYALLIRILSAEGDFKAAIAVCNSAIESSPDSVRMLTECGLLSLKIGQTQQAFERLSSALALNPVCVKALLGVGCITQSHDEHEVALTKYKVAVSNEPTSIALWNNIGVCFHAKHKQIAAISCLKRSLWIDPTNWKVLFNLGIVHLVTHQSASAFNFLCAAVNLRPDVAYTFLALACALVELDDTENAQRAFQQALSLAPDDPIVLLDNVWCFIVKGKIKEASDLFLKCKDTISNKPVSNELATFFHQIAKILEHLSRVQQQETAGVMKNKEESVDGAVEMGPDEV